MADLGGVFAQQLTEGWGARLVRGLLEAVNGSMPSWMLDHLTVRTLWGCACVRVRAVVVMERHAHSCRRWVWRRLRAFSRLVHTLHTSLTNQRLSAFCVRQQGLPTCCYPDHVAALAYAHTHLSTHSLARLSCTVCAVRAVGRGGGRHLRVVGACGHQRPNLSAGVHVCRRQGRLCRKGTASCRFFAYCVACNTVGAHEPVTKTARRYAFYALRPVAK